MRRNVVFSLQPTAPSSVVGAGPSKNPGLGAIGASGAGSHSADHTGGAGVHRVRLSGATSSTVLSKALSTPRHIPVMQVPMTGDSNTGASNCGMCTYCCVHCLISRISAFNSTNRDCALFCIIFPPSLRMLLLAGGNGASPSSAGGFSTVKYSIPDTQPADRVLLMERLLGYSGGPAVLLYEG